MYIQLIIKIINFVEAEKHSETSENLSDDDLMDCTLEEYLSEDENGKKCVFRIIVFTFNLK